MKKEMIIVILVFLILPLVSSSLSSNMLEVERYIGQYKTGELNAPQLVVNIEYIKNKMYEELDKEGRKAFTEAEIDIVFDKTELGQEGKISFRVGGQRDWRFTQYEKKFETDDFHVVFRADSFFRHDKEYYEKRETTAENYYSINYELVAVDVAGADLSNEIRSFISDLKNLIASDGGSDDEYEDARKSWNQIQQKVRKIGSNDNCVEIMESVGMEEIEKDYPSREREFSYLIEEKVEKNCRNVPKCEPVCVPAKVCEDCEQECHEEEFCDEVCEDVFNNEINSTEPVCEDVCSMKEVCAGCEEICKLEDCRPECEDVEQCNEFSSEEIKISAHCGKGDSNLWLNLMGEGFEYYRGLNEGGQWNCENEIQSLVKMRKVLQEEVNNEFAEWYFEEYLVEDYDRMINGADGFKYVLELLTMNEEQISQNLHCSETGQWPEGFEQIDITYINENTHVEVWEKNIPVEWDQTTYYTTLYKYSWIPSRELLKELINYQISETDTFGPSAIDVARIKSDAGQMELINSLSARYGGSFDVRLELKDEDDQIVLKYFQVNPDVTVKFVDSIEGKPDISIDIEYNALYDFISYVSYGQDRNQIKGPNWVHVGNRGGPGNFFGIVGAFRKAWREGITIKPRSALLKLLFNSRNIIGLLGSGDVESTYQGETVTISGEVVKQEW
jgi:hypothetical protein